MLKEIANGYFSKKVWLCKGVSWFNPNWWTEGLKPGIYHFYIRHGYTEDNSIPYNSVIRLKIKDSVN
jgi:hypothetical protein